MIFFHKHNLQSKNIISKCTGTAEREVSEGGNKNEVQFRRKGHYPREQV
nr:MAG TPA: hypothetical protein [Caudoviricetes sp.]